MQNKLKLKAIILCLVLLVPSVTCVLLRREFWPFSHYPMFEKGYEESLLWCGLFGVTEENEEIFLGFKPFLPLDPLQFCSSLLGNTMPKPQPEVIQRKLDALLRLYTFNHDKKRISGPKISSLRYFLIRWHGKNPKEDFFTPEKVHFIAEAKR